MPRPNLLNPSWLLIQSLVKDETVYDSERREPIGDPVYTTYRIKAQRTNVNREVPLFEQYGVNEQVRGWFVIDIKHAENAGYKPKRGDRVIKFGNWDEEVYVVNTQPEAHYGPGPYLMRLYFSDRRPGAVAPDKGVS